MRSNGGIIEHLSHGIFESNLYRGERVQDAVFKQICMKGKGK